MAKSKEKTEIEEDIKQEEIKNEKTEKQEKASEDSEKKQDEGSKEGSNTEALSEEIEKLKDSLLRERAEFMNYKKRTAQERLSHEASIVGRFVQELMPALDSFDSMFQSAEQNGEKKEEQSTEKFIEGATLIHKQFLEVFNNFGVEEINPANEEFDPSKMEALSVQESDEVDKETVKQVFQKGYSIKEKILRPARVLVIKPKGDK